MFKRDIRACLTMAALALPGAALAQITVDERIADGQPAVIIAHRSANLGGYPENSLAWIQYAIDQGIDMVHINPQLTGDGQYVLMHDNTLNRTTDVETVFPGGPPNGPTREQRGGRDYIRDYTLDEIRRLRLTDGQDGGQHPVPTLKEALDLVDGRGLVMLGLKSYEDESLAALLDARDTQNLLLHDVFYSGTNPSVLLKIAELTGIKAAVALSDSRDYPADLARIVDLVGPRLAMICGKSQYLTPEFVAKTEELGIRICISGWNGTEDSALIFKNDPGPWLAALNNGYAASTDIPEALRALMPR